MVETREMKRAMLSIPREMMSFLPILLKSALAKMSVWTEKMRRITTMPMRMMQTLLRYV